MNVSAFRSFSSRLRPRRIDTSANPAPITSQRSSPAEKLSSRRFFGLTIVPRPSVNNCAGSMVL